MEGHGAEGHEVDTDGMKAGLFKECGEFVGPEETRNGLGKVSVGGSVAGNEAAEFGKNLPAVETVEVTEKARGGLGEFKNGQSAAGLEDAADFPEAVFIIGEIAEAEGGGNQIEGAAGKRKAEGVSLQEEKARDRVGRDGFFVGAREHGVGEVGTNDAGFGVTGEGEGKIAGTAA